MTPSRVRLVGAAFAATLALLTAIAAPRAGADEAPPASTAPATQSQAIEAEKKEADAAADKAKILGPAQIALQDQGMLALPEGFSFLPQPEAGRLMRAYGNSDSSALAGLIVPEGANGDWWATLEFVKAGYVKDDDAKNWNADQLLSSLKEATKDQNEDREKRGFPAVEITGWIEPPVYDAPTHRLIWSALVRQIGGERRRGLRQLQYLCARARRLFQPRSHHLKSAIEADKSVARALLADITYNKGKGYEDFDASSDHIAAYGLAALIGGVALKKLGLFALGAAFVLKFAKVIGLGAIVVVAALRRVLGRAKPKAPE